MKPNYRLFVLILCLLNLPASAAAENPEAFEAAHDFTLPYLNKTGELSLSDYRGSVVLVDFWASWCAPCIASLPEYNSMRNKIRSHEGGANFEVLAINADLNIEEALAFIQKNPLDMPVLRENTGATQRKYKLWGMPTSVLIDKKGNIRMRHQGFSPAYLTALKKEIIVLLNEQ